MVKVVSVNKKFGEEMRRYLLKKDLLDLNFKVYSSDNKVYFPVKNNVSKESLKDSKLPFEIADERDALYNDKRTRKLNLILKNAFPDLNVEMPRSYDIVGGLMILKLDEELWKIRFKIGEVIKQQFKNIKGVFAKKGAVKGEYRIRAVEHLAGDNKTITIHKENNCYYRLDISKVYFNSRLGSERLRVASLVNPGEVVTDMFAGVGPFSILIAKKRRAFVNAIDVNPFAIKYLIENINLNKVADFIRVYHGNADEIIKKKLKGVSDRVIMNLPEKSHKFLKSACYTLKPSRGVIHFYFFATEEDAIIKKNNALEEIVTFGFNYKELTFKKVREVAPKVFHYVLDAELFS
ncbi:MAG: class I SAM-dependent methyltransferase [Candidatus Odinarchaeia archaeon]